MKDEREDIGLDPNEGRAIGAMLDILVGLIIPHGPEAGVAFIVSFVRKIRTRAIESGIPEDGADLIAVVLLKDALRVLNEHGEEISEVERSGKVKDIMGGAGVGMVGKDNGEVH